jgi:hypothetical protein
MNTNEHESPGRKREVGSEREGDEIYGAEASARICNRARKPNRVRDRARLGIDYDYDYDYD